MAYVLNPFTGELDYYAAASTGLEIVALLEALYGSSRLSHDDGLSDVSADDHHAQSHGLDSEYHTVSGLSTGHFLKATGATTFAFAAHGLTYSDVGAEVSGAVTSHQSTYNHTNYNTAYDWGDHASGGYALQSVLGTSIGTGLLLTTTVLSVSSVLQTYHGIDPSADVQSVLGCANEAAIRTFLDLESGTDFYSVSTLDTALGLKAALAGPTFTGTVTVPSTNFTVGTQVLTQTNLTDLLDGGDTTLHDHDGISENTNARHVAVTLAATATTGGLSLSTQEIAFRAATNAQTGYATAAHITAIEANTDKATCNFANVQTALAAANGAVAFNAQNLTGVGTVASGTGTLTIDETIALTAKAPIASPTFTTQITTPIIDLTGGQIAFPGEQAASAGANTLDDYEEGTHTVTCTPADSGTVTMNPNYNEVAYTKIGRIVHVHGYIGINAISSPVGDLRFSLPFTSITGLTDAAEDSAGVIAATSMDFAGHYLSIGMLGNTAYFQIIEVADGGDWDYYSGANVAVSDYFAFQLTYTVA